MATVCRSEVPGRIRDVTKVKGPGLASGPLWRSTLPQVQAKLLIYLLRDGIGLASRYVWRWYSSANPRIASQDSIRHYAEVTHARLVECHRGGTAHEAVIGAAAAGKACSQKGVAALGSA